MALSRTTEGNQTPAMDLNDLIKRGRMLGER